MDEVSAHSNIDGYRQANPLLQSLWYALADTFKFAIYEQPGRIFPAGKVAFQKDSHGTVWMLLPSGRAVPHYSAHITYGGEMAFFRAKFGAMLRQKAFGGSLLEIACQSMTRDLVTAAEADIEREMPDVVLILDVYDSILALVAYGCCCRRALGTDARDHAAPAFMDCRVAVRLRRVRERTDAEMMQDTYEDFLIRKSALPVLAGLSRDLTLPDKLRPFQRDIVTWGLRQGRAAIFAGTGLGKTFQQLSWAKEIQHDTWRRILVLAPLAVAQQTVQEAKKFNIDSVEYAPDRASIKSNIVVTNYDRIDNFDPSDFAGIVLDESSIIKAHDSKTRAKLIEFTRDIPYRLPCTATPAPNDYVELGNHAEFLGVCSAKEMLATWFVHSGTMRATGVKNYGKQPTAEWRLKGHAEQEFWAWLSSWSVMVRHPNELGYDEPGYDLPPLHKHFITVPSDLPIAHTLSERLRARRDSTMDRVRAAATLVNMQPDRPWLVWCNSNMESEMLTTAIAGAVEVRGSHPAELKTQRLYGLRKRHCTRACQQTIDCWMGHEFSAVRRYGFCRAQR